MNDDEQRRWCQDILTGGKTARTKKRHAAKSAAKIRAFAYHLEHRMGVDNVRVQDWYEMCSLDRFWVCAGDWMESFYYSWTFKAWPPLNPGCYEVQVFRGITVPEKNYFGLITGTLFVEDEIDWRPREAIPEDYYAT